MASFTDALVLVHMATLILSNWLEAIVLLMLVVADALERPNTHVVVDVHFWNIS